MNAQPAPGGPSEDLGRFPQPSARHDALERQLADSITAEIARQVATLQSEAIAVDPLVETLVAQAARLCAGGKRLRAAFAYWSFRAHRSTDDDASAIALAAALELFQAAALLHDDVIDNADARRGQPTAHLAFANQHRTSGWLGDPQQFGTAAAILAGDLLLLAADAAIDRATAAASGITTEVAAAVRATFGRMAREVMFGQYLDVLGQQLPWDGDPAAQEARAWAVLRAKSASYSVRFPVVLGARLAEARTGEVARITEFGSRIGEAFQLRDDVLGLFGDPARTGKPAGDDLREGKRTVLVCRALRLASPTQAAGLRAVLGEASASDAELASASALIADTGALAEVETMIKHLHAQALAALATCQLSEPGRAELVRLAAAATVREA